MSLSYEVLIQLTESRCSANKREAFVPRVPVGINLHVVENFPVFVSISQSLPVDRSIDLPIKPLLVHLKLQRNIKHIIRYKKQ